MYYFSEFTICKKRSVAKINHVFLDTSTAPAGNIVCTCFVYVTTDIDIPINYVNDGKSVVSLSSFFSINNTERYTMATKPPVPVTEYRPIDVTYKRKDTGQESNLCLEIGGRLHSV